jgi:hypothetical protein
LIRSRLRRGSCGRGFYLSGSLLLRLCCRGRLRCLGFGLRLNGSLGLRCCLGLRGGLGLSGSVGLLLGSLLLGSLLLCSRLGLGIGLRLCCCLRRCLLRHLRLCLRRCLLLRAHLVFTGSAARAARAASRLRLSRALFFVASTARIATIHILWPRHGGFTSSLPIAPPPHEWTGTRPHGH